MKPENTKLIEQYLQNELSAQDRAAFIRELNNNADLLRETALQQNIHEGAKRLAQRTLVQKTAKRYHVQKTLVTTAVVVVVATAIALTTWLTTRSSEKQPSEQLDAAQMAELIGKIEDKLPFDGAPAEYFNLSPKDTVVLSESGVLLSVPKDAFMSGGKIYDGPKVIQWQEAFDAATIVKCGLSTMSGDQMLETGGMFGMQAFTPEGKQLDINPKVGVYVQIPLATDKKDMLLFEGKKGKNGIIDWQNPKPLEKLPVMADMSELDFYTPGYEAYLDAMKWKTGKNDRDSLYLSFEDEERENTGPEYVPAVTSREPAELMSVPKAQVDEEQTIGADNTSGGMTDTVMRSFDIASYSSDLADKVTWNCTIEKTDATHGFIVAKATVKPDWGIFPIDHDPEKADGIGIPTRMIVRPSGSFALNGELQEDGDGGMMHFMTARIQENGKVNQAEGVTLGGTVFFRQPFTTLTDRSFAITFDMEFQACNDKGCIFPPAQTFTVQVNGSASESTGHIPPSKVLAFWQKDFNNTILATRDFERRMVAIHGTCSEEVLDLYTDNLNKPLYEIDAMVAKLGHDQFKTFAEERVGAVKLDNPHMNNMRRFYAHATAMLRKEAKKDRNFVRKQEAIWDSELRTVRKKEAKNSTRRERTALAEEQRINRETLVQQFSDNTIGVTIRVNSPAWNIDAYRPYTATRFEQKSDGSMEYVRENRRRISATEVEVTTRKSTLKYNNFSVRVNDPERYGKLMLYLFPHKLNSYLRIDPVNGGFARALNDAMTYDIAVIGIAEDGYFLYEKRGINEGDLGTVNMLKVSEETFAYRIEALNRNRGEKPLDVKLELDWLARERENYTVQRLRQENRAFRDKLLPKVFPCVGIDVPMSDSISGPIQPVANNLGRSTVQSKITEYSVVSGFAQSAEFPGGAKAMRQYLNENIRFPEAALNRSINGTCTVVFNVERDGSLTNLRVTKNVVNCPECDQEALRVISTMPPWKPAQRNGSPTGDVFTIPIRFKMDGTANVDPEAVSL